MSLLLAFALLLPGCAVVQRVESAIDCGGICERYKSCFDSDYDTGACASRCRRKASEESAFRQKAEACYACIGERSCASATFGCVTECLSVVP